jgi:hypothetical protein
MKDAYWIGFRGGTNRFKGLMPITGDGLEKLLIEIVVLFGCEEIENLIVRGDQHQMSLRTGTGQGLNGLLGGEVEAGDVFEDLLNGTIGWRERGLLTLAPSNLAIETTGGLK